MKGGQKLVVSWLGFRSNANHNPSFKKTSGAIFESAILGCGWGERSGSQQGGQFSRGSGCGIRVSERIGEKQSQIPGSLMLL